MTKATTYLIYQVHDRDLKYCSEWWTYEEAETERKRLGELQHILIVNESGKDLKRVVKHFVEASKVPIDPQVAASRAVGEQRRKHNRKFRKHSDSRETIE